MAEVNDADVCMVELVPRALGGSRRRCLEGRRPPAEEAQIADFLVRLAARRQPPRSAWGRMRIRAEGRLGAQSLESGGAERQALLLAQGLRDRFACSLRSGGLFDGGALEAASMHGAGIGPPPSDPARQRLDLDGARRGAPAAAASRIAGHGR